MKAGDTLADRDLEGGMETAPPSSAPTAIVIGAGPAGLAAAEVLASAGVRVAIHDRMPTPARKLLMAGRGGLNLTHSEPLEDFLKHYGAARAKLEPAIRAFPPSALRAWCEALGQETFIGSSGRVFPRAMKASPLLRAWLARLAGLGVTLQSQSRWTGWTSKGALTFDIIGGINTERPGVTVFALGGASWPRLGSDGGWTGALQAHGANIAELRPANSGFTVQWSDIFRDKFAGQPLKNVRFTLNGRDVRGEAMITRDGIEGGAIYALSASLRETIAANGEAVLAIDLAPDMPAEKIAMRIAMTPGQSLSNRLRRAGLSPLTISLLREGGAPPSNPAQLAAAIKDHRLRLTGAASIGRAISTAGGVTWDSLNADYSLRADPAVFVCGEMLDWEAPTGGYLLQACFATGRAAAQGALARLNAAQ